MMNPCLALGTTPLGRLTFGRASLEQKKNEEKELKHPYKTNVNIMVSELKDELILIMMEKNEKRRKRRYNELLQEIARNVIPIRPGRHNERNFKKSRDRYPMNARRGL